MSEQKFSGEARNEDSQDVFLRARQLVDRLDDQKELTDDQWKVLAKYVNNLRISSPDDANVLLKRVNELGRYNSLQEQMSKFHQAPEKREQETDDQSVDETVQEAA